MRFRDPQIYATVCGYHLQADRYQPGTLINVGVGSCPELFVWRWLFPHSKLVGIDPKRQNRWDADYVQAAAVSDPLATRRFCRHCESLNCEHRRKVDVFALTTIDMVSAGYPPPYFLWLDTEGNELDALLGAEKTLAQTRWLSLEAQEFPWTQNSYVVALEKFLKDHRFRLAYQYPGLPDRLYRKR